MINEQLKTLVKYRIEQSKETLEDSKILLTRNSHRGSINRSYYAMFYSVLALLAIKKLGTSKHAGAISLFDKEYVKEGIFPKELSKSLHIAFDHRQTHDYGELIEIDEATAGNVLSDAQLFVNKIESYLISKDYL